MNATPTGALPAQDPAPGDREARVWDPNLGRWPALLMIGPLLILLVAFVLYPLVKLGIDSVTVGDGFGNYSEVFSSESTRKALITTLLASLGITAVTVGVGAVLAWYICNAKSGAVKVLLWLAVLTPFWMGTVVKNYAIVLLISNDGLVNDVIAALGFDRVEFLYTVGAVMIGIIYSMIPYAVFALYGVFSGIDPSLPLAARSMGASRSRAIRSVVLPLALPGIVASAALVFSISVGFYVTPVLLGGGQTPFMASVIDANIFGFYNYGFASAASFILLAVTVLVLGVALKLVGRERLVRAVA